MNSTTHSENFIESEKTEPKVDGKWAEIVKELIKGKMSDKKRTELLEKRFTA